MAEKLSGEYTRMKNSIQDKTNELKDKNTSLKKECHEALMDITKKGIRKR